MDEYVVQGSTLRAIAGQARRLVSSESEMTPAQIITALQMVPSESGNNSGNNDNVPKDRIEIYQELAPNSPHVLSIIPPAITSFHYAGDPLMLNLVYADILTLSLPNCTSFYGGTDIFLKLREVDLPLCTSLSTQCFYGCTALETIQLPSCVSIPLECFHGCSSLINIDCQFCASVGEDSFSSCTSLETINMPSCVSVDSHAFLNCEALESVYLNTACTIGNNAFDGVIDPDTKVFKLYMNGTTVGSCDDYGFGSAADYAYDYWSAHPGAYDDSGHLVPNAGDSGEEPIEYDDNGYDDNNAPDPPEVLEIPGLEIYVPAELLDDFIAEWPISLSLNFHALPADSGDSE